MSFVGVRMPFVLGWNALFGRTDKVPGLLFVGTSFFYFCFIPLIPLGSYIVRYEDDDWFGGFKGVPIGISIKSVLFAWMRAAAVIAILFSTCKFICDYIVHILYWGQRTLSGWPGFRSYFAWSVGALGIAVASVREQRARVGAGAESRIRGCRAEQSGGLAARMKCLGEHVSC